MDVFDPSTRGTTANRHLETRQRLGVTFRFDLHAAVLAIPYPPPNALSEGRIVSEETKANSLHAPRDDVAAGGDHTKRGLYRTVRNPVIHGVAPM